MIKHGSPCGAAWGTDQEAVWAEALSGDPQSAFGGIVATGFVVDDQAAALMAEIFLEVVVAPGFTKALERFSHAKRTYVCLKSQTCSQLPCRKYKPAAFWAACSSKRTMFPTLACGTRRW